MFSSAWGTSVQILAVHPNPTLISIATDTTNELSDIAMHEVIKRAVNTFNAISNNNSYEKVSNELSKLE